MAPSKNLYVAEADIPVWEKAERWAAENRQSVSKVVTAALRDYIPSQGDDVFDVFIEGVSEGDMPEFAQYDPAAPLLWFHRRNRTADDPEGTWKLHDEQLSDNPTDYVLFDGTADQDDVRRAVRMAREHLSQVETGKGKITVEVGERGVKVGFEGQWLVEPDSDQTRTAGAGYDAGAYWGVALTKKGRIAVYMAHCNDGWPAVLKDFDTIDEAAELVPADILAEAAEAMGKERVVWRDI